MNKKDLKKIWASEEWDKRRSEILNERGEKCEECGGTEVLQIHHGRYPPLLGDLNRLITYLFSKSEECKNLPIKQIKACPNCGGTNNYERKLKTPKYKCNDCKHEFEELVERDSKNRGMWLKGTRSNPVDKGEWYKAFRKFKDENIEDIIELYREERKEWYLTTDDVKVMCRKCHHASEKGKMLCKICGKNYHSLKYQHCSECKVLCEDCGENYHSREYEMCYVCYKKKESETCPHCGQRYDAEDVREEDCDGCPNLETYLQHGFDCSCEYCGKKICQKNIENQEEEREAAEHDFEFQADNAGHDSKMNMGGGITESDLP